MVARFTIHGIVYQIDDDAIPGAGWSGDSCVMLHRVLIDQITKRGKITRTEKLAPMLRTNSIKNAIAYIAQIEQAELAEVEDAWHRRKHKE